MPSLVQQLSLTGFVLPPPIAGPVPTVSYQSLQEQQQRRIAELTARVEGLEKRLQDASKVGMSPV